MLLLRCSRTSWSFLHLSPRLTKAPVNLLLTLYNISAQHPVMALYRYSTLPPSKPSPCLFVHSWTRSGNNSMYNSCIIMLSRLSTCYCSLSLEFGLASARDGVHPSTSNFFAFGTAPTGSSVHAGSPGQDSLRDFYGPEKIHLIFYLTLHVWL
jgi:hypothetical protein